MTKPGPSEATPSTAGSVREAICAAVTKHCHVNMKWPATAVLDDLNYEKFVADIRSALALSAPVEAPVAVKRPVLVDDQNSASGKRGEWHATPNALPSRDELERSVRFNSNPLLTDRAIDEQAKKIVTAILTLLGGSAR